MCVPHVDVDIDLYARAGRREGDDDDMRKLQLLINPSFPGHTHTHTYRART